MQHIHRNSLANQLFFSSLEYTVYTETPVRVIYAFVEALALHTLIFLFKALNGRSLSCDIKSFLKSIYGYLNGVRNSIKLEQ
jgi:hypothetical protein